MHCALCKMYSVLKMKFLLPWSMAFEYVGVYTEVYVTVEAEITNVRNDK